MIGLIRLLLRFVWLTLFILGVRRAIQIIQGGIDEFVGQVEQGEGGTAERALTRLHDALHRRHQQSGNPDAFGEI